MQELSMLKDFIDLGGTFILSLALIWVLIRKLEGIEEKLVKILTLLTIVTTSATNYNDIEHLLGKDSGKVVTLIQDAEAATKAQK